MMFVNSILYKSGVPYVSTDNDFYVMNTDYISARYL
jgi:hypothetical protein